MIPPAIVQTLTAGEFAEWLNLRTGAIVEKVRAGQLGDAVGMLKSSGGEEMAATVALCVACALSDTDRYRLRDAVKRSTAKTHGYYRKEYLRGQQ